MYPTIIYDIRRTRARITTLSERISELEEIMSHAKIADYDSVRVKNSPRNVFEANIVKLEDWKTELTTEATSLQKLYDDLEKKLLNLDWRSYRIAFGFAAGRCAGEIADELGISEATVYKNWRKVKERLNG